VRHGRIQLAARLDHRGCLWRAIEVVAVEGHPIEDGFKFHDYLKSVGRTDLAAFVVTKKTMLKDIESSFCQYEVKIDLDRLYESCPFAAPPGASVHGTWTQAGADA
jgi:hypothetical protein